jgi:hypothetical protein
MEEKRDRVAAVFLKDNKVLLFWRFNKGREYYIFPGEPKKKVKLLKKRLNVNVLRK